MIDKLQSNSGADFTNVSPNPFNGFGALNPPFKILVIATEECSALTITITKYPIIKPKTTQIKEAITFLKPSVFTNLDKPFSV